MKRISKREGVLSGLFGLTVSLCLNIGYQMEKNGEWKPLNLFFLSAVIVGACIVGVAAAVCFYFIREHTSKGKNPEDEKRAIRPWQIFLLLLLCYLPVFLAVYPGFFVYDAQEEYIQVATREFTTHHPVFHVLLLGGLVQTGYKFFHSYNIGIAIYTLFQMVVMAGTFTYILGKLKAYGMKKTFRIISFLFPSP